MSGDLSVVSDVFLEVCLSDGWFLLIDDVDEKALFVLASAVTLAVLAAPLYVTTVFLLELSPNLTEKDNY